MFVPPGPVFAEDERGVRLDRIAFNPRGEDTGRKSHLNREHVLIVNDTNERKNIRGWTVRDLGGDHIYTFEKRLVLAPGDVVDLITGRGDDATAVCIDTDCPTVHFVHWDLDEYVWDNDRDRARLVRPDGSRADSCGYGIEARSPKRC